MTTPKTDALMALADRYAFHIPGSQHSDEARAVLLAALQEQAREGEAVAAEEDYWRNKYAAEISLGKSATIKMEIQLDEAKESINALTLALEVERDAANLYAKQVAHWIGKHDALLEQQLAQPEQRTAGCTLCGHCAATGEKIQAAQPVAQPLTDEQIDAFWNQQLTVPQIVQRRVIARAIEAAHGIGGGR